MRKVPTRHHNQEEWLRIVAEAINQLQEGRVGTNNTITLTANAATTVKKDFLVGKDSVILFMPLTANAAAELYGGTMYVKTTDIAPLSDQFTINHANNAQTDRDFRYVLLGETRTNL